jgi:hypothetical protein
LKVVSDDDINFSAKELLDIKEAIVFSLKNSIFNFNDGTKISNYDFIGPGISLWLYIDHLKRDYPDKYTHVINEFSGFLEAEELITYTAENICAATNNICWNLTALDKKLVTMIFTFKVHEDYYNNYYPEVKIKTFSPEVLPVCINGNNRPAFRVGITMTGSPPIWINLDGMLEILGLSHLPPETRIPVYIQHHALNRLKERIDCANSNQILVYMQYSLALKECINYHGHWLIAYYFNDHKIGYLLFDLVKDVIVIRTFLLLSHFDTPEGDALHKILGFEKPDISYLNLDKLSTFVFSGLKENLALYDLFTRAGCNSLIDIPKDLFDKKNSSISASVIEAYLGKYHDHKASLRLENLFAR